MTGGPSPSPSANRYDVRQRPQAELEFAILESIDKATAIRLKQRIKAMAQFPYAADGLKKLGNGLYRLKQGDWRALILIDDEQRIVMVDRVVRKNEATYKYVP